MPQPESDNQTEEIFKELLSAEREQEITQTTTVQGQIVALVLTLQKAGVLKKSDIDEWEELSEKMGNMLGAIALAREAEKLEHNNVDDILNKLVTLLNGSRATIEFLKMMGNGEEAIAPFLMNCEELEKAISEMGMIDD